MEYSKENYIFQTLFKKFYKNSSMTEEKKKKQIQQRKCFPVTLLDTANSKHSLTCNRINIKTHTNGRFLSVTLTQPSCLDATKTLQVI